jgi:tetratricopeptide (TPR) repeat protein
MVSDIKTQQIGNRMDVMMRVDMSQLKIKSNHSLRVTPYLTNGQELIQMPAIIIDGRRRSIVHLRESDDQFPSSDIYVRRHNNKEQVITYEYDMPYESWMQNAEFAMREEWCACHDIPYSEDIITIAKSLTTPKQTTTEIKNLIPQMKFAYAIPKQESIAQTTTLNIYFPVSKSQIDPNFMGNSDTFEQLRKAMQTQDIESAKLIGCASPEGPYPFNTKLALARAEHTNKYLTNNNLSLPNSTITSGPVDWAKLREMLQTNYISNHLKIIAIIDDVNIKAEDKNRVIREQYPLEYNFMLHTWYPKLRTTAITLNHKAKAKTLSEAKSTLQSNPKELSLADLYMVALSYEKGSKVWNDIIILAVENYPNSNEAKVNAANVAMANGNYAKAAEYLNTLPQEMPEAMNSRGILAMANGDYNEAMTLFEKAQKAGISEATYNLSLLKELIKATA